MKTIYKLFCACLVSCGIAAVLTSCGDDDSNTLQVGGDCIVEQLALDNYEGIIDLKSRTVVVRVPENYDTKAMKVTAMKLSTGATCNVTEGQTLNMGVPRNLTVKNGDLVLDWTLSVLRDEARITQFVINDIYTGSIDEAAKTAPKVEF